MHGTRLLTLFKKNCAIYAFLLHDLRKKKRDLRLKKYATDAKKQKSAPVLRSVGDPLDGRGYVANPPTCGPLLTLPPRSQALGTPETTRVM